MSNRENWSQNAAAGGAEQTDGQNSGPRVLMVLLVVLALIASILMLFLDSDLWLKIAVIAALWAAFLGIVLVSKYSSALRAEQKRVNTLERAHRAEMEREVAGHQQREAALKENYTRQLRNQRDEHLEQLRHELISLRAQLAEMSGEELDDEQTAVRARAERIIELDRGGQQPADRRYQSGNAGQPGQPQSAQSEQAKKRAARSSQPGASARAASSAGSPTLGHNSEPSSDRRASAFSTGSFAAVKWTGDNTEETTQIPIVVDSSSSSSAQSRASGAQAAANRGSEAAEPKAAGRGQHERREAAQAPQQERAAQPAPRTEPAFRSYEPSQAASEQASESAQKSAAPQAKQGEQGGAHEYRAGRRRADENAKGLTVAELMKRFQQNDKN